MNSNVKADSWKVGGTSAESSKKAESGNSQNQADASNFCIVLKKNGQEFKSLELEEAGMAKTLKWMEDTFERAPRHINIKCEPISDDENPTTANSNTPTTPTTPENTEDPFEGPSYATRLPYMYLAVHNILDQANYLFKNLDGLEQGIPNPLYQNWKQTVQSTGNFPQLSWNQQAPEAMPIKQKSEANGTKPHNNTTHHRQFDSSRRREERHQAAPYQTRSAYGRYRDSWRPWQSQQDARNTYNVERERSRHDSEKGRGASNSHRQGR
ncbi:YTH domain-containing protein [Caenorhabditis elegans]|uniref:YTH domain-containing protein n=1 Tax=Caenorhabditis elegans TaxID=6239 RepID=O16894_CAEEL|nr:YTH domain-containing protein [Caenorhabditis elegans]CCD69365.2 YTH domain-containing protein [Caenorhabditis elegans]|eukprot:NP_001317745.1 Uncharacterized protein CELE_F13A2.3 [Caenorhabditis elegans]